MNLILVLIIKKVDINLSFDIKYIVFNLVLFNYQLFLFNILIKKSLSIIIIC